MVINSYKYFRNNVHLITNYNTLKYNHGSDGFVKIIITKEIVREIRLYTIKL